MCDYAKVINELGTTISLDCKILVSILALWNADNDFFNPFAERFQASVFDLNLKESSSMECSPAICTQWSTHQQSSPKKYNLHGTTCAVSEVDMLIVVGVALRGSFYAGQPVSLAVG